MKGIRMQKLGIEELEQRIAPAGNVVVEVSGGSLVVTGDGENNHIVVTQTGADQYSVASGVNATLINGEAGPLVFGAVTKDVRISTGSGG